ncbi:MAG: acyl-CoA thioesterase [Caldisericaceae bacterium]|nr:acyl-CoA thioesterase [Caldisericaceae bacterium]
MEFAVDFRVRYAETDQMKFAHHSAYIVWFEMARIELFRSMGLSYAQMEKDGVLLPVLQVSARYFKPAFFDDSLRIVARFAELNKARLKIDYQVFRQGTLICEGFSLHAFMNEKGKPIRPPEFFLEKMKG